MIRMKAPARKSPYGFGFLWGWSKNYSNNADRLAILPAGITAVDAGPGSSRSTAKNSANCSVKNLI